MTDSISTHLKIRSPSLIERDDVLKGVLEQREGVVLLILGGDCRPVLTNLTTDYLFACPARNLSRIVSNQYAQFNNISLFLYSFQHVISFYQAWGPNFQMCRDAVCHASELPFVFHSATKGIPSYNFTPSEEILSEELSANWGNFATNFDPNKPLPVNPDWPPYDQSSEPYLLFSTPSSQEFKYKEELCDFWDTIGYINP